MPTLKKKMLGDRGELFAAEYLASSGFDILERNWRHGHLELDLICRQNEYIIFVEVKTRMSDRFGGPLAGMTGAKIANVISAAQAWLDITANWHRPCRFDVVCCTGAENNFILEHYPDAFQLQWPLGYSHTNW